MQIEDLPALPEELQADFQDICESVFTVDPHTCLGLPNHALTGSLLGCRSLEINWTGTAYRLVYRIYESPAPRRVLYLALMNMIRLMTRLKPEWEETDEDSATGNVLDRLLALTQTYPGRTRLVLQQIVEMTLNGSGVRDIARVLYTSPTTVINELKKLVHLKPVNQKLLQQLKPEEVEVDIIQAEVTQEQQGNGVEESELDEMWSYVGKKANPRWRAACD